MIFSLLTLVFYPRTRQPECDLWHHLSHFPPWQINLSMLLYSTWMVKIMYMWLHSLHLNLVFCCVFPHFYWCATRLCPWATPFNYLSSTSVTYSVNWVSTFNVTQMTHHSTCLPDLILHSRHTSSLIVLVNSVNGFHLFSSTKEL